MMERRNNGGGGYEEPKSGESKKMSRRDFLKGAGVVALAAFLGKGLKDIVSESGERVEKVNEKVDEGDFETIPARTVTVTSEANMRYSPKVTSKSDTSNAVGVVSPQIIGVSEVYLSGKDGANGKFVGILKEELPEDVVKHLQNLPKNCKVVWINEKYIKIEEM